jgi:hypothetical protein
VSLMKYLHPSDLVLVGQGDKASDQPTLRNLVYWYRATHDQSIVRLMA